MVTSAVVVGLASEPVTFIEHNVNLILVLLIRAQQQGHGVLDIELK
jgi:hypothetical protein